MFVRVCVHAPNALRRPEVGGSCGNGVREDCDKWMLGTEPSILCRSTQRRKPLREVSSPSTRSLVLRVALVSLACLSTFMLEPCGQEREFRLSLRCALSGLCCLSAVHSRHQFHFTVFQFPHLQVEITVLVYLLRYCEICAVEICKILHKVKYS